MAGKKQKKSCKVSSGKRAERQKRKMKKKEARNNKKSKTNGHSTPEDFVYGFLVLVCVTFSFLCFNGVRQIPTSISPISLKKNTTLLEKDIKILVRGYPIDTMTKYIGRKNEKVAAYLIAIAKKESNWGRRSPKKYGRECYNFWGYRGKENPTPSGYSCFDSPKQAVNVVGKRIGGLLAENIDTPREMVLWKCGSNCSKDETHDAQKWIKDVGYYYNKIYN